MSNEINLSSLLLLSVLLSACGQSGPLYMPGHATGVHKKDVFLLNSDGTEVATPAAKDNTQSKTQPAANTAQINSTPAATNTTTQETAKTEQSKPSD